MRVFASITLLYYAIGVFLLQGDFNVLGRLDAMYDHCKSTEDKDMTWVDFITDHLVCFDALVDSHPPGDDQRPHSPLPTKEYAGAAPLFAIPETLRVRVRVFAPSTDRAFPVEIELYRFDPVDLVFRPPNAQ